MANSTTTQLNQTVKEIFDARIQASFDANMPTLKKFKRTVGKEEISSIGRYFAIKVQSNESYGSQATEGGAFPAAGRMVDVKALVNYRSQFKSFAFTGDVEDLRNTKTLQDYITRVIQDSTESFDEVQEFFLFGDGTGVLAQIDSVATNDITCLNTVAYPQGARFIRAGQVLNAYDVSGAAYRSGDMTVASVARSTDVVSVDTAAGSIASDDDDVLVFDSSYNYAPQGLKYHVLDSGTWLGLSRSTYPNLKATVHDAASASVDFDMIELADLKSRNNKGDAAPKFGSYLIMHPVQHKNLRALARSSGNVSFNAQIGGNQKIDMIVPNVAPGGQEILEASWCPPSDIFGLRMDDWALEEVVPRQLYKHSSGDTFIQQIAASTAYGDAKEGRVYWRYNWVCKAPFRQYRIKNVNFATAETRINRM